MKLALSTMAAFAVLTAPADAASKREVRAMHRCDQTHPGACILRAALHRHQDPAYMRAVAYCESRLSPAAVNSASGASGLFQFLAGTWATTPYGSRSRFSAKWSSLAAAWMWQQGRRGEWSCA